jgi:hypothetical protein
MADTSLDKSLARDRITSAKRRLGNLVALGYSGISARPQERQQFTQEFFLHAVGAVEMLAQLVNQGRALGKSPDQVSPPRVVKALSASDPIVPILSVLYANTRKNPMPADPYSDAGYIWRLWNYRHQVSHRGRNPFDFRIGGRHPVSLRLDPGNPVLGASKKPLLEELQEMIDFVEKQCEVILVHLT